jgi:hypothetical protein
MELPTSTNNVVKKQLFLKKNVIVKFKPVNADVKIGCENRNDIETTTITTIPTTSGIYTFLY